LEVAPPYSKGMDGGKELTLCGGPLALRVGELLAFVRNGAAFLNKNCPDSHVRCINDDFERGVKVWHLESWCVGQC
jgi:hypothetical protein